MPAASSEGGRPAEGGRATIERSVVVGSGNPVKIRAVADGFGRMFPRWRAAVESVAVPSGVAAQPRGDAETLRGALRRAEAASVRRPEAEFWVGIEGGVEETPAGMAAFAWVVVRSPQGGLGRARSGAFLLPDRVADLVRQGRELGEANDLVFDRRDSKRAEGAIGLLSGGAMDRRELYEHAVILALLSFRRPDLYPPPESAGS